MGPEKHFKELCSAKMYYTALMRIFKLNHFGHFMCVISQTQLVLQELRNVKIQLRRT